MLKDETTYWYNILTQNYCTDQMYNWAFNETRQVLINQGKANYEPSKAYMIYLIIDKICKDVYAWKTNNRDKDASSFIVNLNLTSMQVEQLKTTSQKADGTSTQIGGGIAGAGAGYMFGGILGAAVGGFLGALAGNKYNNQNRQKFYDVLRECIGILTSSWYQNNLVYEQKQLELMKNGFINKMTEFGDKYGLGDEELAKFGDDALKMGYNVAIEDDLEKIYEIVYKKKPSKKIDITTKTESLDDVLKELNELIGLENVKAQINSFVQQVRIFKMREEQGLPNPNMSYHLVFTGNPGTGKTTVARIVGRIYKALGILSSGHLVEKDRSGLVAGYIGQTAIKTQEVIDSSLGGVLFIDEAYSLARSDSANDYGKESIDTLLKAMEDNRNNLVVIVAGYSDEMVKFIQANPGLKSRFKNFIHFDDYNGKELYDIFMKNCKEFNYVVDENAKGILMNYFEHLYRSRGKNFGNARDVRNLFENTLTKQSQRLFNNKNLNKTTLQTIMQEDLDISGFNIKENVDDVLKELNELIGLENVKAQINSFVNQVKVFKMREEQGLPTPSMSYHLVFTGNPGTGKTTVARIVGRIYKALGILSTGNIVEKDRSGLVAGWVGQTAIKTQEAIDTAMGGVLFIDEAYSLVRSDSTTDFGPEAIDTLIKAMEDNRNNLVVIAAGYSNEMERFINANPGLKSRFKTFIHFDDYDGKDLYDIFMLQCKKSNYVVDENAKGILMNYFEYLYRSRGSNFGNARDVRNIFENTITKQSQRVSNNNNGNVSELTLKTIMQEDLPINY